MAVVDRPLFSKAIGYPPLENLMKGIRGWEPMKQAFSAVSPTKDQQERRAWAATQTGLEPGSGDPLTIGEKPWNPDNKVDILFMNHRKNWGDALARCQRGLNPKKKEFFWTSEEIMTLGSDEEDWWEDSDEDPDHFYRDEIERSLAELF